MTERQRKFAEYYVQCGNAEQAAVSAGYSEQYARGNAYKLVANSGIAAYIKQLSEAAQTARIMTARGRQELLSDIARDEDNAAADRKTTLAELKTLKSKGSNTVCPDYPQPAWFYELCDELGLYVIDRANINAPDRRDDRRVGGTPSNDPALADAYLERVKAMYYRSRNHTCVVAFALGGESGNGYNMYKAYEWLKSVEKSRPVIYTDADGEWNSDL